MGIPLPGNLYNNLMRHDINDSIVYDAAITGGGLAGLALSVQLARAGYSVILFEKEQYPFHKVCGEYISMESWDFLVSLGLDPAAMNVSRIRRLQVSAPSGKLLEHPLQPGGFGISRYRLDHALMKIAADAGVYLCDNTKADAISFANDLFTITAGKKNYTSRTACGCFGKRSNMDTKWKRSFILSPKNRLGNYVGIKYHIKTTLPADMIALHNFDHGYCGIVKIEDDRYCLCYLTSAINLRRSGNSIEKMEADILCTNPHLKRIFGECEKLYDEPLVISQVSFDKKEQVYDHVLLTGDAAGMIAPLCGNGMSMALHGSMLAFTQLNDFLQGKISRAEMENNYSREWKKLFSKRLRTGRFIQRLFGGTRLTNIFISMVKPFPGIVDALIKRTHGSRFG